MVVNVTCILFPGFLQFIQENKGNLQKLKRSIPNLTDKQILSKAIDLDAGITTLYLLLYLYTTLYLLLLSQWNFVPKYK